MYALLQDIFVISHSPSGMETGKSKSEERSKLLTDPVVTGIAYEINKANKKLNQHRLQVSIELVCITSLSSCGCVGASRALPGQQGARVGHSAHVCMCNVPMLANDHRLIMCLWMPIAI